MNHTPGPAPDAATDRRRWIALVVLCAGFLMIILDQTIVNVALPTIQSNLRFSQSSLAWVVNAYLIAFGGLLLLVGRLGDLIGRRRIFLAGLTVFTAASMVCGFADSQALLIGARFVQGVGGAMTSAVILGIIVTMFPTRGEQARAIGVYSFVAAAGGAIGLLAGGVLTQALNWHWIFFVNLPIGLATGVFATRLLPSDSGLGLRRGADAPGALLLVAALMLAVYTIVEASDYGWGSAHTLGFGGLAAGLLAAFVARQALAANPLIPLRVFRSRTVTVANLMQVLMIAGMFGMFFLGALYLQRVLHYDAIEVGLAFLPVAVGIAALSLRLTARLMMRFGAKPILLLGLVLVAAGLVVFRRAPGLVNTTQQVGGALGLAVLATLSTTRSDSLRSHGVASAAALMNGYHLAFTVAAVLVLAAIAVGAVLLQTPRTLQAVGEPVAASEAVAEPAYLEEAA
jgi:EmrB/QacA subfamily drug resistance transporter